MGGGRSGVMSDPRQTEPDADLLEFLGGIDEANEDPRAEDFSDFLASSDIDELPAGGEKSEAPAEGKKHE
jgi:hypothetical protein